MPDITGFQVTQHSKGNAEGTKAERPNHRIIPPRQFEQLGTLDAVLERLFGALP